MGRKKVPMTVGRIYKWENSIIFNVIKYVGQFFCFGTRNTVGALYRFRSRTEYYETLIIRYINNINGVTFMV
jgi:hypothetical protein